ncbi:Glycoside hydrolase 35 catalytic domain [Trinorchestia longiramus]|nr:Glycoside hydrolase 35 catalytic domain [Trinorchestia longiramus]
MLMQTTSRYWDDDACCSLESKGELRHQFVHVKSHPSALKPTTTIPTRAETGSKELKQSDKGTSINNFVHYLTVFEMTPSEFPRASGYLVVTVLLIVACQVTGRSFTIDYDQDCFSKDDECIQIVSGSIHYYRIHPTDWTDRLSKLRYAGFNTVQTYIEWASHEPEKGQYDFSGMNNLTDFITKAQQEGLMVILRPGPFIDAERDMGGLPYWLLAEDPALELRSSDPAFMSLVDNWYVNQLLPKMRPFLYSEGGPVIMVQVENEYGSYGCDFEYTGHLRDILRVQLGDDILLYTTDGSSTSYLKCGKVAEVYATIDFGTGYNLTETFKAQRLFEPRGPLMNSEFYTGWLDHWGSPHSTVEAQAVADSLDALLAFGASVNLYVFHGGTNFGLTAGSNLFDAFEACPTSYDYDAPLSEAGDMTYKYELVRNVVGQYLPLPAMTTPTNSTKVAYGDVLLSAVTSLFSAVQLLPAVENEVPLSFEALGLFNGLVIYETILEFDTTDPALLSFESVNDRGYVYLDEELVGLVARQQQLFEVPVYARKGQKLSIVVESQGRICYGQDINDSKGVVPPITLGANSVTNWTSTAVPLTDISWLQSLDSANSRSADEGAIMFYNGTFRVTGTPADTFLRVDGWTKGVAWVNGYCLGRYWPVMGPQETLYVPHGILKTGDNVLTLLELEAAPDGASTAIFTAQHQVAGPTPQP